MTAKGDSAYFEETKAKMKKAGWDSHAIRLLFNNGIVDDFNTGKMTLAEAKMHYPAVEQHPLFNRKLVKALSGTALGSKSS